MSLASLPPYEEDPREFAAPDRTPPQDVQAEQSVLGAMLLSKDAIGDVTEIVRGRDFYLPKHEQIFEAILDLFGRGEPADAITVADELAKRGEIGKVGGHIYLHDLLSMVSIASNASFYAEIVKEKAVLRRLVEASIKAIREETGVEAELSTSGGTSDGRFISEICPQVIEIGPLNASIHKIDECVEIAALPQLSAIYRRLLEQLLA